jgi:hypothetical protein
MPVTADKQPMNKASAGEHDELSALSGLIAAELKVTGPDAQRDAVMASALLDRARQSAIAHRNYVTLRREARSYAEVAVGMRSCTLRHGDGVRIDLVQLDPGAALTWPAEVLAQEILVMTGAVRDGSGGTLKQHELCVCRPSSPPLRAGIGGAHLYVRQLIAVEPLPAAEQLWWNSTEATRASGWEPLSEGVEIKGLRRVGDVMSTLARIAPGAAVVDHGHGLDEDCMMLQGDLFLGDILLRENDYQMAPAGGTHVNSMSDTGALFYFHGCMPTPV